MPVRLHSVPRCWLQSMKSRVEVWPAGLHETILGHQAPEFPGDQASAWSPKRSHSSSSVCFFFFFLPSWYPYSQKGLSSNELWPETPCHALSFWKSWSKEIGGSEPKCLTNPTTPSDTPTTTHTPYLQLSTCLSALGRTTLLETLCIKLPWARDLPGWT